MNLNELLTKYEHLKNELSCIENKIDEQIDELNKINMANHKVYNVYEEKMDKRLKKLEAQVEMLFSIKEKIMKLKVKHRSEFPPNDSLVFAFCNREVAFTGLSLVFYKDDVWYLYPHILKDIDDRLKKVDDNIDFSWIEIEQK